MLQCHWPIIPPKKVVCSGILFLSHEALGGWPKALDWSIFWKCVGIDFTCWAVVVLLSPWLQDTCPSSVVSFVELHSHSLASALAQLRDWEITVARTHLLTTCLGKCSCDKPIRLTCNLFVLWLHVDRMTRFNVWSNNAEMFCFATNRTVRSNCLLKGRLDTSPRNVKCLKILKITTIIVWLVVDYVIPS